MGRAASMQEATSNHRSTTRQQLPQTPRTTSSNQTKESLGRDPEDFQPLKELPQLSQTISTPTPPYSIFSTRRKQWTVWLMALASWFSPASSFIYFPAIVTLAESLGVSVGKINLTVTSYLIVSAVAPAMVGSAADEAGRRPALVLSLGIYILANIGLAVQRSYVALLVLRMLQSAGISGSIAVSYGVVADMTTPAERGGYVGIISFGANTAPAISPVIGTLLLSYRGWTSIFWFLTIISGLCLVLIIFTLPETARNIVGNGSLQPPKLLRVPFSKFYDKDQPSTSVGAKKTKVRLGNPLSCLVLFWDPNNAIVIYSQSVCYMALTVLQASLSSLFIDIYGLSDLQGGLVYLPFGVGCAIAAFFTGKILDRAYKSTAKNHGLATDKSGKDDPNFPIAKARLKFMAYYIVSTTALTCGYGWLLSSKMHISVPLIFQFLLGCSIQSSLTTFNTLLTDLNMSRPSTAQATCNLVRCTLAAAGTGVLQLVIDGVGVGWCFTILAVVVGSTIPGLWILWGRSVVWRLRRKGSGWQERAVGG